MIRPSPPRLSRRAVLLGLVLVVHLGVLAQLLTMRSSTVRPAETSMKIDFVEAMPMRVSSALPPPERPSLRRSPPPASAPVVEATASFDAGARNAPAAPSAEPRPVSAAASGSAAPPGDMPIVSARFDADYLRNPVPPYPSVSRRRGEEGTVVLRVRVSAEGTAEHIEIKTTSGSSRLDEAAQRTVRSWKFVPAKRAGTPLESWVLVPIVFRLEQ